MEYLRDSLRAEHVTIRLAGGTYFFEETLFIGSGVTGGITFAAREGETVVFSGGKLWHGTVKNNQARQLFVNGEARKRSRYPKKGTLRIASVPGMTFDKFMGPPEARHPIFYADPGDLKDWSHRESIEVVAVHYWNEERMPLGSLDPETGRIECLAVPQWPLKDDCTTQCARFWFENLWDELTEKGEWFINHSTGEFQYKPLDHEALENTVLILPETEQLIKIEGEPDRRVSRIAFEGITFAHTARPRRLLWGQSRQGLPGHTDRELPLFRFRRRRGYSGRGRRLFADSGQKR